MAQQTAMQKLFEWVDANVHEDSFNINNAKEMSLFLEKEQIKEAYCNGNDNIGGEQYYNETYEKS